MRSCLDCIPCFVRQSLKAARWVSDDPAIHEQVLRGTIRALATMDLAQPPPLMAVRIQRILCELTRSDDPYLNVKTRFNRCVLALLPELRRKVADSPDPFAAAVRLAIAGNVIDVGPYTELNESMVHEAIDRAWTWPLSPAVLDLLRESIGAARRILYLADNAGEIVLDRLLLEQMPTERITVAVKGRPILNDALLADAEAVGLAPLVRVIDNGADAPGTILDRCSERFREEFHAADLILAKGQANFETLNETDADVFFLLMAKCPIVARVIGCALGDMIVQPPKTVACGSDHEARGRNTED